MVKYNKIESKFKFGEKVEIKLLELYGYVTAVCYRGEHETYEISYFSNGEYYKIWFYDFELEKTVIKND